MRQSRDDREEGYDSYDHFHVIFHRECISIVIAFRSFLQAKS